MQLPKYMDGAPEGLEEEILALCQIIHIDKTQPQTTIAAYASPDPLKASKFSKSEGFLREGLEKTREAIDEFDEEHRGEPKFITMAYVRIFPLPNPLAAYKIVKNPIHLGLYWSPQTAYRALHNISDNYNSQWADHIVKTFDVDIVKILKKQDEETRFNDIPPDQLRAHLYANYIGPMVDAANLGQQSITADFRKRLIEFSFTSPVIFDMIKLIKALEKPTENQKNIEMYVNKIAAINSGEYDIAERIQSMITSASP
jgi:hypothetical protein